MARVDVLQYLSLPRELQSKCIKKFTGTTMEIQTPTSAFPEHNQARASASPHNGSTEIADAPANNGHSHDDAMISLDDYLAQCPPSEEGQATISKASLEEGDAGGLTPKPVGARSSKNTVELHDKYQFYALDQPKFTFTGDSIVGWGGKVEFLGESLSVPVGFASKQDAKESLSGKALEVLARKEADGTVRKPVRGKKKKSKAVGGVGVGSREEVEGQNEQDAEKEVFVNWTGQLLEYQRSISSPQPIYTDYMLGTRFSCTCAIDGIDTPFGSPNTLFSSKKVARQNAARCAVEHFKAAGTWPDSFTELGGIKKNKKGIAANLANAQPTIIGVSKASDSTGNGSESGGPTFASQVAQLSTELNLGTLEWRYTCEQVKDFHTVGCYFKQVGGGFMGPYGEVRHVYGKKKAKEECAQEVLVHLQGLREKRREHLRKLLEGSDAGVQAGKGKDDGEKADTQAEQQLADEMDLDASQSTEYDEFVDAVEEMIKGDV